MSVDNQAPGDVNSIGSSHSELEDDGKKTYLAHDEIGKPEVVGKELTTGQKRPRRGENESCGSDGSSPDAELDVDSPPRGSKRAKWSSSAAGCRSQLGSEEGEIDESDNEPNPRAALEAGKTGLEFAPSRSGEPVPLQPPPAASATIEHMSSTETRPGNTEADHLEVFAGSTMPPNPPTYKVDSSTLLKLPALSSVKQGSWFARLKDWALVFCQCNLESMSVITPAVALDAFAFYLDQHSGLRQSKRKAAKQAAEKIEISRAIQNVIESLKPPSTSCGVPASELPAGSHAADEKAPTEPKQSKGSIEEEKVGSNGTQASSSGEKEETAQQDGDTAVVREGVPTGEEELQQQRRYFPSAIDPSTMCLLCGGQGHRAIHCAKSKCRFCKSIDHWDFCCPSIQERCDKCRQLGHQTAGCSEKLALTKEEGLACAYCNSNDHLEGNCTELWRSFQPDAQNIHRVVYLPRSCSVCGGKDHFSGDCRQRRGVSANPTWSLRNRDMYIDPECNALCIEETADSTASKRSLRASETKIRGHAARTANIVHFSETDDSEVEFLGKRAQREPKGSTAGRIRLSSNIQMPQMMGSHRVNSFQPLAGQPPPLPPGPPPAAGQSRAYPPPRPSLPPKPPASTQGYRNVPPPEHGDGSSRGRGRGDQRGRGAGRGGRGRRGRGRGRGRPAA